MTIRPDNSTPIILDNIEQFNNRSDIRDFLLNQWMLEAPSTKYRYFAETLVNGDRIYLERPGRLNKGCDFVIFIENHILFNNGNDKPPKHDFVLDDLAIKKQTLSAIEYQSFLQSITEIYNCSTINTALTHVQNHPLNGESYELILKILRWLFIEQDITYWAKSGRQMLFDAIQEV